MPLNKSLKKVMVIGSGPIVIGQAAEFDYAGTQACRALKEEGLEVVLVNSNPATIMTDSAIADHVYIEPLTLEFVKRIIEKEKPDSILSTLGGQTGLTLSMELAKEGFLKSHNVTLLGASPETIDKAEDRQCFKDTMEAIGEPVIPSKVVTTIEDALDFAEVISYPVIVRPAFTLGGTGGGIAANKEELYNIAEAGIRLSPINQILVEKCISGWKEIEFEVMRDAIGNEITVCSMENFDPVGVHTGDSIVIAPAVTLADKEYQMLRSAALNIIQAMGIEGGCNVQYALNPESFEYAVIEVNPRVSRSSALASKATGFPIALVSAMLATGLTLKDIPCGKYGTLDKYVPDGDYVVIKFARWAFEKFKGVEDKLGTQMRAVGEVMSIGKNYKEAFQKAIRSLETGRYGLGHAKDFDKKSKEELLKMLVSPSSERHFIMYEALRKGATVEEIHELTKVKAWFINQMKELVEEEEALLANKGKLPADDVLIAAKKDGFSDKYLSQLLEIDEAEIRNKRIALGLEEAWEPVHVSGTQDKAYYYSTYNAEDKNPVSIEKPKVMILGGGPNRIGQGIEFDYCCVHASLALKQLGFETIIVNCNPETVSTDYDTSDKLYFEPLTLEDVLSIYKKEKPVGVIAQFGGQTPLNLAADLEKNGVKILGTPPAVIDLAEDRDHFRAMMDKLGIPMPESGMAVTVADALHIAEKIGYPVMVRPSYVLGGRAMQIVADENQLRTYLKTAVAINEDQPVLVDKYIQGKELEVDAVCDGYDVFVPGIMEHVERTGVHSGDSISVYPTFSVSNKAKGKILEYTKKLGLGIGIIGLFNIQFIVDKEDNVYVIEVNPRSSRTVPFLSKATGYSLADIATLVILGKTLKEQGIFGLYPDEKQRWYVKVPAFSFSKLHGMDTYLSPEMKSTGEAIGYDNKLNRALYKALQASGMNIQNYGTVLATIADKDKEEALPLIRRFYELGFNIEATKGTADFLKEHGIRTRTRKKLSDGSEEIFDSIRQGYVSYVINTRDIHSAASNSDGQEIRQCAVENNVTVFTALDTVRVLLDVLEETTLGISTIDA